MIVRRHTDWENRLNAEIIAWRGREYAHAAGRDCASFAAACVRAVTGINPLPPELRRYSTAAGQARALAQAGWADLVAAGDACLGDRIPPLAAHFGDVVSDGAALGVMTPAGALAFSEAGMVMMGPETLAAAWVVGRADGVSATVWRRQRKAAG